MWSLFIIVYFLIATGESSKVDEKDYVLPQFTELDDYDKCFSMKNAFYCFGTFRIFPNDNDKVYYDYIKKYSNLTHNYDRTLLHRGYCMSSRCPSNYKTGKAFEKCVQDAHKDLNVSLTTLHSCQERKTTEINLLDWCYVSVISVILILNILGTIGAKSNSFWKSWCIRSNWQQLVGPFGKDPDTVAFAPIQGLRVFLMSLIVLIHVVFLYAAAFLYDPVMCEQLLATPYKVWVAKSSSVVQVFYALSVFFTADNLLKISKKQTLSLGTLQDQIIKRYFRIAPAHLLFVGFAATLWPHIFEGPMWPAKIHTHSAICRKRFWYHVLHVNNVLLDEWELCLSQTWSLAVDIQFQIISLTLTILLIKYYYIVKIKILTALLISSCLFNTGLAYINNWKPLFYLFDGKTASVQGMNQSFSPYYYLSLWGNLPSCLLGLLLAHVYYNWRQKGTRLADYKLLSILCRYSFPLLLIWIFMGQFTQKFESRLILALYLGAERPVFSGLACIGIFGMITGGNSPMKRFLSWHGWIPLGRLSLSVLLVHWVIIESHLASQIQPIVLSNNNTIMVFVATWCLSYILAVPVTLLVELPIINTHKYLLSRKNKIIVSVEPKKLLNGNGKQE